MKKTNIKEKRETKTKYKNGKNRRVKEKKRCTLSCMHADDT